MRLSQRAIIASQAIALPDSAACTRLFAYSAPLRPNCSRIISAVPSASSQQEGRSHPGTDLIGLQLYRNEAY
jgi:hypothetical protein